MVIMARVWRVLDNASRHWVHAVIRGLFPVAVMDHALCVRVPASTSGLGPGLNALGMALSLYDTVVAVPAPSMEIRIEGEGARDLPHDETNVVVRAIARACEAAGRSLPSLRLRCTLTIPLGRGLGSRTTAVVAGLLLGDALCGGVLGRHRVLSLAGEMEGHVHRAAAVLFGGLQVTVTGIQGEVHRVTVPVRRFPRVVLFVPDGNADIEPVRTDSPVTNSGDEVLDVARVALLVAALAAGRDDLLAVATEDARYQRGRQTQFPAVSRLFRAAREAGALGAWQSGSGPAVVAFARESEATVVAAALECEARAVGLSGRSVLTSVDEIGAVCERR